MIVGILAIAAESIYLSSRILRTMSHQKLIPEFIAKVDSRGRPRWSLGITVVVAVLLTYINLSGELLFLVTYIRQSLWARSKANYVAQPAV
jgi:amino acid transporter